METDDSRRWPIEWSAVWVGALAALAVGLIIGLLGFAVGAHQTARGTSVGDMRLLTFVFSVAGAFFAYVAGGWAAARIGGFRRAEPAMLHGALAWLIALPLVLVLGALGATAVLGGWYGGLSGTPAWVTPPQAPDQNAAEAARNNAFGALLAVLLGLVGSVIGGWMASGEPMSVTYYRQRQRGADQRPRRAA
jgi:hypothetical protein